MKETLFTDGILSGHIKTNLMHISEEPNWQAYRMELMKRILPAIIEAESKCIIPNLIVSRAKEIIEGVIEYLKADEKDERDVCNASNGKQASFMMGDGERRNQCKSKPKR